MKKKMRTLISKINFIALIAMLVFGMGFTSCNKDGDNPGELGGQVTLVGTWVNVKAESNYGGEWKEIGCFICEKVGETINITLELYEDGTAHPRRTWTYDEVTKEFFIKWNHYDWGYTFEVQSLTKDGLILLYTDGLGWQKRYIYKRKK